MPRELANGGSLGVRGLRFAGHDFDVQLRQAHATIKIVLEFDRPVTLSRSGVGDPGDVAGTPSIWNAINGTFFDCLVDES